MAQPPPDIRCRVRFEPSGLKAEAPAGATILDAAWLAGVYLSNICGGDVTVTVPADHPLDTGRILVGVDTHRGPHAAVEHTFPFSPLARQVDDPDVSHYGVAIDIGLLPDVPTGKIRFVGNTCLAGAKMALLSREAFQQCTAIARGMTYIDLINHPGYLDECLRANFLPHTNLALFPSTQAPATRTDKADR